MSTDDRENVEPGAANDAEANPSPLVRALAEFEPREPPACPKPDIEQLLKGHSMAKWLHDEAHDLAENGGPLQRLAAIGLLIRLWMPSDKKEQRELLHILLTSKQVSEVEQRCLDFLLSLPERDLDRLGELSAEAAGMLSERFDELQDAVAEERLDADMLGQSILLARDDLESVLRTLRRSKAEARLGEALADFDNQAAMNAVTLREANIPPCERLAAVADMEPQAWWAQHSDMLQQMTEGVRGEPAEAPLQGASKDDLTSKIREAWATTKKAAPEFVRDVASEYRTRHSPGMAVYATEPLIRGKGILSLLRVGADVAAAAQTVLRRPAPLRFVSTDNDWDALVSLDKASSQLRISVSRENESIPQGTRLWLRGLDFPVASDTQRTTLEVSASMIPDSVDEDMPEVAIVLASGDVVLLVPEKG